jgi:hypothetical protein
MKKKQKQVKTEAPGNLEEIPRLQRPAVLLEAFLNFPSDTPYGERIKALAAHFKTTEKNVYQTAQRYKWKAQLAAIAEQQRKQEEQARVFDEMSPIRLEVPTSQVVRQIKDLSWLLLSTGQKVVRTATIMIDYYSQLIATKVASVGGLAYLSEADAKQVNQWQNQLNTYAKSIADYLKPGAVASLLELVNFKQNLPANLEGVDPGAFTPARLQATLLEMGLATAFQIARGESPAPANGQTFAPYTSDLPDLPHLGAWPESERQTTD